MTAAFVTLSVMALAAQPDPCGWTPGGLARQATYESALNAVADAGSLRRWHDRLGSRPHVAGTAGDRQVIELIAESFQRMGLQVQRQEIDVWLALPVSAAVEIVSPVTMSLPVRERPLGEDPYSDHPDLMDGWNAYSAGGDVTAEVVYANYGTKQDFQKLGELGIDVTGKVVLARYGQNFRGLKARFAEAAGAAGLILYTDPDDSGYRRGIPYPQGGWANDSSIQRGSIDALDYPGDPLTPGRPAVAGEARLDPREAGLPGIPVQPIGWGAAAEIMGRMTGPGVPAGWQGGLPLAYRLTGGGELRVRLAVRQDAALRRTANVIGTLPGAIEPRRTVIIGCHHDAWGFGASDPLSGTIVLMECARSFAEAAGAGHPPDRTLVFAAWGAEEFGIIGSVEWCEAHRDELASGAVAYINLDMAAMGTDLGGSAAPALKRVIASAAQSVPKARGAAGETALARPAGEADPAGALAGFGSLGGGSDHVGFYCHLGVTSCSLGAGGSPGTAYHSNYDTLAWYRKVVGDDYQPALMLARLTNVLAARLAMAPLLPIDLPRYAPDLRAGLSELRERAEALHVAANLDELAAAIDGFDAVAGPAQERVLAAAAAGRLDQATADRINASLLAAERLWVCEQGLPGRPWFRNLYAATDPDSGYAAWLLPALRYHLERGDAAGLAAAQGDYVKILEAMSQTMRQIEALVGDHDLPPGF